MNEEREWKMAELRAAVENFQRQIGVQVIPALRAFEEWIHPSGILAQSVIPHRKWRFTARRLRRVAQDARRNERRAAGRHTRWTDEARGI